MKENRNSVKQKTVRKKTEGRAFPDVRRGQSARQIPGRNYPGHRRRRGIYGRFIKRPLDVFCALLAAILLSPAILITALLVRIKLGSPVIFTQKRPGLNEKIFKLYKFRSMTDARDADGNLLPDGKRLGKFGRALRATSLDELPELINILKGDMAVVGPRPLLVDYLPRYSRQQHRRHEVRPGLTGYAQVHGRNAVTWEERLARDVWYVEHVSFRQDVKIILQTVGMVLKRQGVSAETCATMEEFSGTKPTRRLEKEKAGERV